MPPSTRLTIVSYILECGSRQFELHTSFSFVGYPIAAAVDTWIHRGRKASRARPAKGRIFTLNCASLAGRQRLRRNMPQMIRVLLVRSGLALLATSNVLHIVELRYLKNVTGG